MNTIAQAISVLVSLIGTDSKISGNSIVLGNNPRFLDLGVIQVDDEDETEMIKKDATSVNILGFYTIYSDGEVVIYKTDNT